MLWQTLREKADVTRRLSEYVHRQLHPSLFIVHTVEEEKVDQFDFFLFFAILYCFPEARVGWQSGDGGVPLFSKSVSCFYHLFSYHLQKGECSTINDLFLYISLRENIVDNLHSTETMGPFNTSFKVH